MKSAVFLSVSLALSLVTCSSPPPKQPADFPTLPGDKAAVPAPRPSTSPQECMPAGVYAVEYDLSKASFAAVEMSDAYCRAQGEQMPHILGDLVIAYTDGDLEVTWPEPRTLTAHTSCSFALGDAVPARLFFAKGVGTGTIEFAFGASNHPNERCTVRNAAVRAVQRP